MTRDLIPFTGIQRLDIGWRQIRERDGNAEDEKEIDNTAANGDKRWPWHITDCHYPGIALQQHFTSVLKERAKSFMFAWASGGVNAKAKPCKWHLFLPLIGDY